MQKMTVLILLSCLGAVGYTQESLSTNPALYRLDLIDGGALQVRNVVIDSSIVIYTLGGEQASMNLDVVKSIHRSDGSSLYPREGQAIVTKPKPRAPEKTDIVNMVTIGEMKCKVRSIDKKRVYFTYKGQRQAKPLSAINYVKLADGTMLFERDGIHQTYGRAPINEIRDFNNPDGTVPFVDLIAQHHSITTEPPPASMEMIGDATNSFLAYGAGVGIPLKTVTLFLEYTQHNYKDANTGWSTSANVIEARARFYLPGMK